MFELAEWKLYVASKAWWTECSILPLRFVVAAPGDQAERLASGLSKVFEECESAALGNI